MRGRRRRREVRKDEEREGKRKLKEGREEEGTRKRQDEYREESYKVGCISIQGERT